MSSAKKAKPTAEEAPPQIDEALAKITKYKRDSIEKKQIDNLVLGLITKDIQPLSVVENEGFRDLVHRLDRRYEIVSRSHLTKVLLPENYKTETEKLIKELEEVDHVATTTDHWTSRANESYATMTAHYITADWELKSPVLFTRSEGRRQTAKNLAEELTAAFAEFGIYNKVRACVTDNAPNASKSVTLTDADHHNCFAHTLNLAAAGGISKDVPTKDIVKKVKAIVKFFHCSAVANRALCLNLFYIDPDHNVVKKILTYKEADLDAAKDTSVNKLIILALGYKVTENYANIKAIWDKLDINQIDRPYKIAADLKMANVLFGLMSHSSCHPCTWDTRTSKLQSQPKRTWTAPTLNQKQLKSSLMSWKLLWMKTP